MITFDGNNQWEGTLFNHNGYTFKIKIFGDDDGFRIRAFVKNEKEELDEYMPTKFTKNVSGDNIFDWVPRNEHDPLEEDVEDVRCDIMTSPIEYIEARIITHFKDKK